MQSANDTVSRPRSVLVTGANGYIGSSICRAFVRAGWEVFGLVRKDSAATELTLMEAIPVVGTFTDHSFLQKLYERRTTFDVIVSCTEQIPGYAAHFEQVFGLVRALAEKSHQNGVRSLVLWTSGCKDYGTTDVHGAPGLSPHTEDSLLNSIDVLRERTESCRRIFDFEDLFDAVLLRPTCVFGYSSSYYGTLFDYAAQEAKSGAKALIVPGNPNSIMHATHVDDCAEAYVLLATHERHAIAGHVFNISGRRYETSGEVANALANEYGFTEGAKFIPSEDAPPSFPPALHFVFSFSQWVGSQKIRDLTGWKDKRQLFSESIGVHRRSYEMLKEVGHGNILEIQRRAQGVLKQN